MNENMSFVRSRHNRLLLSLHSFERKGKTSANFLDANLIRIALECRDTSGLACSYRDTLGRNAYFQKR
jgi:hypothetical protein